MTSYLGLSIVVALLSFDELLPQDGVLLALFKSLSIGAFWPIFVLFILRDE